MRALGLCLSLVAACAFTAGCGRRAPSVAATANNQHSETDPVTVSLQPLSQLNADRPTHLTIDPIGNIYWVQETADGNDIVFVAGQDEVPRPTLLTSEAILAASGPPASPGEKGESAGNIESLATDSEDRVLFFFSGGVGRSMRVCLGRFDPIAHSIQILASTQTLADASKMGASIGVARGEIIKPTQTPAHQPVRYWLWLHHSDAAGLFRFDPTSGGGQMEVTPAFDHLSGDGAPASLAAEGLVFSAGFDQSLLLIDWPSATLFRVDPSGNASRWMSLLGLPQDLSTLLMRPSGVALTFGAAGDRAAGSDGQSLREMHTLPVTCPALLAFDQDQVVALAGAADIQAPPTIDVPRLKLGPLVQTSTARQWIGYDSASGILMKIQLTPKQ